MALYLEQFQALSDDGQVAAADLQPVGDTVKNQLCTLIGSFLQPGDLCHHR